MGSRERRIGGIAATVLLHAGLLFSWQLARQTTRPDGTMADWIQLINIVPRRAEPPPPSPPPPVAKPAPSRRPARTDAAPIALLPPTDETAAPEASSTAVQPAAPAKTARELVQQAQLNIGELDKELLKEDPRRGLRAPPPPTAIVRLREGIQEAFDAKPNAWYEAPKIAEVVERGQGDKRTYKVVGALGTYCLVYHAPGSFKGMEQGTKPDMRQCDKYGKKARTK